MKLVHRNENYNVTNDTDSAEARHIRWHIEHRGHESMHAEMVLIIIVTIILGQIGLFYWKRFYFKSYQLATTFGMWTIPYCVSIYNHYYRFLIIHSIYSSITIYMIYKSTQRPMLTTTPRMVYAWFYAVFKFCHTLGAIGYIGLLCILFGLNVLLMIPVSVAYHLIIAMFYGIYFGILNRDVAEICADKIASSQLERVVSRATEKSNGLFASPYATHQRHNAMMEQEGFDKNSCFICGDKIFVPILTPDKPTIEKSFRLECGHVFHEFCIRGWCIVGKKQTCPYCKEKVDLKTLFPNPWERLHVMHSKVLDFVRYLIAWQPLITLLIEAINHTLDLK